ncbi:hypothetical protein ACNJRK_16885, partial [Mycobacterium tuberculosis]
RISATIRTARSRSSGGYLLDEPPDMTPSFPRTGVSGHAGAVHNFPQSQRIAQLCHPNLRNTFPPLRMRIADASGIPYVGRILVNVQVVPHWEGGCAAAGMVLAG